MHDRSTGLLPAALAADSVEALHAELGPARPWTYLTILALAAGAVTALPLVRVDVTLRAPAQVRAAAERAELRLAVSGRIARLHVSDNARVAAGQPVLELDCGAVDARLNQNRARQVRARALLQDLSHLSTAAGGVAVLHHHHTPPAAVDPLPRGDFLPHAEIAGRGTGGTFAREPQSPAPDVVETGDSGLSISSSVNSPAAETGAVAAEASDRAAAGAPFSRPDPGPADGESAERPGPIEASGRTADDPPPLRPTPTAAVAELPASEAEILAGAPAWLRAAPGLVTAELRAEFAEYLARRSAQAIAESRARAELGRVSVLTAKGIATARELDEARYALARTQAESDILRQQSLARWQTRRRDEELALIALVSEEAHLGDERTSFIVRAPVAGTLLGLAGLAEGAWVTAGQPIGAVSPDDALVIEAAVPPQRIGFVREGQPVRIAVETYAPTEWGTLEGRVAAVSADLHTAPGGGAHYKVLIVPGAAALTRADGATAPLRKGMATQARFIVARRSLLQVLHDKSSRWLDPRRGP